MARFDVKSLFTNIPLTETIDLCVENLYKNQSSFDNLWKSDFRKLIRNIKNNSMVLLWVSTGTQTGQYLYVPF